MLRVAEVISGLGRGGAEVALVRRTRFRPDEVKVKVYSTQPSLDELVAPLTALADYKPAVSRWRGRRLWRQITTSGADVVVVHNPIETCVLLASRRRHDPPLVVVAHLDVTSPNRHIAPVLDAAMRLLNRRAMLHIAVSPDAAAGAQCRGARRVETMLLGAEVDESAVPVNLWSEDTGVRFLFVGRFVQQKNLIGLVSAVGSVQEDLRSARAGFVFVGYGPQQDLLQRHIAASGVEDLVTLHQALPDASGAYKAADWFVVSSHNEGGPLTLVEALLSGCRVLSTPVGIAAMVLDADHESVLLRDSSVSTIACGLVTAARAGVPGTAERSRRIREAQRWHARPAAERFYERLRAVAESSLH